MRTTTTRLLALALLSSNSFADTIDDKSIRYIGRVNESDPTLVWAGSGFETSFTGTSGSITFTTYTDCYVSIFVDGCQTKWVPVKSGVPIDFGITAAGQHTVKVIKTSDPSLGNLELTSVDADGTLQKTPPPTRRIELIGDSISIGYGVEGVVPCMESSQTGNVLDGFAWLAAQKLGAEPTLISVSGRGVYRSAATISSDDAYVQMPDYWLDTVPGDLDRHTWTFPPENNPDVVIIELGTNDFAYLNFVNGTSVVARERVNQSWFVTIYTKLVQDVRAMYGRDIPMVLLGSPMLGDTWPVGDQQHSTHLDLLRQVVSRVAAEDERADLYILDLPSPGSGESGIGKSGCDYHPNKAQQQQYADLLVDFLQSLMDWTVLDADKTCSNTTASP